MKLTCQTFVPLLREDSSSAEWTGLSGLRGVGSQVALKRLLRRLCWGILSGLPAGRGCSCLEKQNGNCVSVILSPQSCLQSCSPLIHLLQSAASPGLSCLSGALPRILENWETGAESQPGGAPVWEQAGSDSVCELQPVSVLNSCTNQVH